MPSVSSLFSWAALAPFLLALCGALLVWWQAARTEDDAAATRKIQRENDAQARSLAQSQEHTNEMTRRVAAGLGIDLNQTPDALALAVQTKQAEQSRAEQAKIESDARKAVARDQVQHRSEILAKLHEEYLDSHDGISPEIKAGTAPLPKDWVNRRLEELGEKWRID